MISFDEVLWCQSKMELFHNYKGSIIQFLSSVLHHSDRCFVLLGQNQCYFMHCSVMTNFASISCILVQKTYI